MFRHPTKRTLKNPRPNKYLFKDKNDGNADVTDRNTLTTMLIERHIGFSFDVPNRAMTLSSNCALVNGATDVSATFYFDTDGHLPT